MTDIFSPEKRREIMQSVRRNRTRPEEILASILRESGIRFRRNVASLPGSPDFFLPDYRVAVFVHGCFWHGHSKCAKGRSKAKTNRAYWCRKILNNQRRDHRDVRRLRAVGISVFTLWECSLSAPMLAKRFASRLRSSNGKAPSNA